MGKIKTLREDVYKKIAAGEVVERPLSVVKELVENSIDAGADTIDIELADGGKQLIKITDNGSGFDPDDIETAFKNHSTSKISELADFDSLYTLGFRGEALPSILEVSRIEVQTANNNEGRGILCIFEGNQIVERRQVACSQGTTISVKELFFNFPVRKKFLKSDRTELTQIISFLEPVALVHYNRSFELIHNNKTVFVYKKARNLQERIYQIYGKEFLDTLHEVNYQQGDYQVHGLISNLNTGNTDKKHQFFFVNRRPVKEKTLVAALNNTFQRFLEKNRSPIAFLMLDIPPSEVDVNIHPMKLEIKFVNSNHIYQIIKYAIEDSFGVSDQGVGTGTTLTGEAFDTGRENSSGSGYQFPDYATHKGAYDRGARFGNPPDASFRPQKSDFPTHEHYKDLPPIGKDRTTFTPGGSSSTADYGQTRLFPEYTFTEEDFTIIGQYRNSYIIVEKNESLLVVDQHNAQERVNFDELKKEYQTQQVATISPLFPVIIDLAPSEISLLDTHKLELLEKLGFRLEPLSGHSYDIKSFPQVLGEKNIKEALRNVIHMDYKTDEFAFEDSVLAEIACKSAIKVNHKLYPDQMKTIVKNLFKTTNPYFCPHKRPIIVEFTLEQIEKLLKRK